MHYLSNKFSKYVLHYRLLRTALRSVVRHMLQVSLQPSIRTTLQVALRTTIRNYPCSANITARLMRACDAGAVDDTCVGCFSHADRTHVIRKFSCPKSGFDDHLPETFRRPFGHVETPHTFSVRGTSSRRCDPGLHPVTSRGSSSPATPSSRPERSQVSEAAGRSNRHHRTPGGRERRSPIRLPGSPWPRP